MLRLNLGCSDDLRPGYLNIDRGPRGCAHTVHPGSMTSGGDEVEFHPDRRYYMQWDLCEPWPFRPSSVEEIIAHDVFEHIDTPSMRGQKGIIYCMNRAWDILRPGGILDLVVPCWPGPAPWVDPTHVSVWMADHRYYFDERWNNPKGERGRLGEAYGIRALFRTVGGRSGSDWTPISYAADAPDRHKLFLKLEAVK